MEEDGPSFIHRFPSSSVRSCTFLFSSPSSLITYVYSFLPWYWHIAGIRWGKYSVHVHIYFYEAYSRTDDGANSMERSSIISENSRIIERSTRRFIQRYLSTSSNHTSTNFSYTEVLSEKCSGGLYSSLNWRDGTRGYYNSMSLLFGIPIPRLCDINVFKSWSEDPPSIFMSSKFGPQGYIAATGWNLHIHWIEVIWTRRLMTNVFISDNSPADFHHQEFLLQC